MKFDVAVGAIERITELRRIAGAHVVDHRQLENAEIKDALLKVRPQYVHKETVLSQLETLLWNQPNNSDRVLARIMLADVLLDRYEFLATYAETEQAVIQFEQSIIDDSNEIELLDIANGDQSSRRFRDVELYNFVLSVAWEHEDQKSPDEVNLLRKLRGRLSINDWEHRVLEAKLGKFPSPNNVTHTRSEIDSVRKSLQAAGLLFSVKQEDGTDVDVIPEEIAETCREFFKIYLRTDSYLVLLDYKRMKRKPHLQEVLDRNSVSYGKYNTVGELTQLVLRNVSPANSITSSSPRYGLNNTELHDWCVDLTIPSGGNMDERLGRILQHFDELRPRVDAEGDERIEWYEYYEEFASRDRETLRAQHLIEKDLEMESKFEKATDYLFEEMLNHSPLKQVGSNHPDGILSMGDMYLMWDNKSKDAPGSANLKDHLDQFHGYMEGSDKPVPVFLVIAPSFTDESESEAVMYQASHLGRNISLITAAELKSLAEEWSSSDNKSADDPFPLGFFATSGRFSRAKLGKLIT